MTTLPILDVPTSMAAGDPNLGIPAIEAEMLLNRLAMQAEQLRYTITTRPWQAPDLKAIARMLECACRTAFADKELWGRIARKPDSAECLSPSRREGRDEGPRHRPVLRVRDGGLERASILLDQAADRLMQLGSH